MRRATIKRIGKGKEGKKGLGEKKTENGKSALEKWFVYRIQFRKLVASYFSRIRHHAN